MSIASVFGAAIRSQAGQNLIGSITGALTQRAVGRIAGGSQRPVKVLQLPSTPQITQASIGGGLMQLPNLARQGIAAGRALVRAVPGAGRAGRIVRGVATAGGVAATGALLFDEFGNVVGTRRKTRRINPMNVKAMRRACRRLKAGKKICKAIDKACGTRRPARACAPAFTRRRKC